MVLSRVGACARDDLLPRLFQPHPTHHPLPLQTVRSYLCALPKTAAAQEKSERLEKLLARYRVQRGGSQAALMRALLAVPGVSPEAAYAAAMQFESLQQLLEHAER